VATAVVFLSESFESLTEPICSKSEWVTESHSAIINADSFAKGKPLCSVWNYFHELTLTDSVNQLKKSSSLDVNINIIPDK